MVHSGPWEGETARTHRSARRAVLYAREAHRGSRNMERGTTWFSPRAFTSGAVPECGRRRRCEGGGDFLSWTASKEPYREEWSMAKRCGGGWEGSDAFRRIREEGRRPIGREGGDQQWVFNTAVMEMKEKGDGSQRGAVLMRGTETGRSAQILGSGWA
jgi:hypothetical protein